MKQVEWTESSVADMLVFDEGIARRVKEAVARFAKTGAGSVRKLQAIDPPEYRLRVGDYRVRFDASGDTIRVLRVRHRREAYQ